MWTSLCVAWQLAGGCSLLFEEAESAQQEPKEACTGVQRTYSRGAPLGAGVYEALDYRQGTVTLWVQALDLASAKNSVLVDLAGIELRATVPEGLTLRIGESDPVQIPTSRWQEGEDTFVSFRWDVARPLSGTGGTSNLEVRVNQSKTLFNVPMSLEIPADEQLLIGPDDGSFGVDQVVVYDRPLFVSDFITEPSVLVLMSEQKRLAPSLADAGFDVVFATASPTEGGCDNYRSEAWGRPAQLVRASNLRVGELKGWGVGALPAVEPIFGNDGMALTAALPLRRTVDVLQGGSYVLEVLTHTRGAGAAIVKVFENDDLAPSAFIIGEGGTRDEPERLILTFEVGADAFNVDIELSTTFEDVDIHSVALYENLLVDTGFNGSQGDAWDRDSADQRLVEFATDVDAYAGEASICVASDASPEALLQEADKRLLETDRFYLFGAAFRWRDGVAPGASIGNGSFFATGVPLSSQSKAGVLAIEEGVWKPLGDVGRYREDSVFNNHNALIRFGAPGYGANQPADFCLDSAFTLPVRTLP